MLGVSMQRGLCDGRQFCGGSVVNATARCLSSRVSMQLSQHLNKLRWFTTQRLTFAKPTLYYKGMQVSPKMRALPSENSYQTLNSADFSAFSPWHADHRNCCELSLKVAVLLDRASVFVHSTLPVMQSIARFISNS